MADPSVLRRYRLVVFDADDTLRRTTVPGQPCPRGPGEWELLPGVSELLRQVDWGARDSPEIGIASNQDQIGYGWVDPDTARGLLRDLARAATGITPPDEALQLCPHRLEMPCSCRKPGAGMLHRIMEHYGVGPGETLFVGNSETDRLAAEAAGVHFVPAAKLFDQQA